MDSAVAQPVDVITRPKTRSGHVLLPYQEAWVNDPSDKKIWEKSRRIGATYAESYDVAAGRITGKRNEDYWFSSADESAAYEFADYCRFWAKMFDAVVDRFTEQIEDPKTKQLGTAYVVRFASGKRMTAMTSNHRRFRSKGGDVGLDEFDYHDQQGKMYDAAEPCTTWGGRLRILSTYNGQRMLYTFVQMGRRHKAGKARPGDIPFSVHRVTLPEAVEQGLVELINRAKGTALTREGFLKARRDGCRNEDQWRQEYLAIPSTDTTAWLPYDLIAACEDDAAGRADRFGDGPRYIGMDVGETKDLTTIWTLEQVGDVLWTRELLVLTDEPLRVKQDALLERLRHPRVVRACIDATGVGAQIAQEAKRAGKGEAVKFTLAVKDELASPLRGLFEDRRIRVPADQAVREDLHAVRMTRTAAGNPRFDAERTEAGHADRFWALALANHAATSQAATPAMWVPEY